MTVTYMSRAAPEDPLVGVAGERKIRGGRFTQDIKVSVLVNLKRYRNRIRKIARRAAQKNCFREDAACSAVGIDHLVVFIEKSRAQTRQGRSGLARRQRQVGRLRCARDPDAVVRPGGHGSPEVLTAFPDVARHDQFRVDHKRKGPVVLRQRKPNSPFFGYYVPARYFSSLCRGPLDRRRVADGELHPRRCAEPGRRGGLARDRQRRRKTAR